MNEFEIIRHYFRELTPPATGEILGTGDDCALLALAAGEQLVVSTDSLVAGRHFAHSVAPYDLGYKALAVNLSDLAAMGASPRWFTLALTLDRFEPEWLQEFARGMSELARTSGIGLVGGDTTRGPLNINVTVMGAVEPGRAMRRDGARIGDVICVTGTLGDAALALRLAGDAREAQACMGDDLRFLQTRLHRPEPRIAAGRQLSVWAHAAVDISDGLAADLSHILAASHVGAELVEADLPQSGAFLRCCESQQRRAHLLHGGDDYELCICMPEDDFLKAQAASPTALVRIGRIVEGENLSLIEATGDKLVIPPHGFRHFE